MPAPSCRNKATDRAGRDKCPDNLLDPKLPVVAVASVEVKKVNFPQELEACRRAFHELADPLLVVDADHRLDLDLGVDRPQELRQAERSVEVQ